MLQAIGKRLALVPEINLPERNAARIVANLKAITGGDLVTVNRKHKKNLPLKLGIKILMQSNHFVPLPDNSGALQARTLPLRLTRSFKGQEDIQLAAKLAREYPGILLWTLEGAKQLWRQSRFTVPESTGHELAQLLAESAPLQAFVEECCELSPMTGIQSAALYQMYCAWCNAVRPGEAVLSEANFGRELRGVIPLVQRVRQPAAGADRYKQCVIKPTAYDGAADRRQYLYVGIGPRDDCAYGMAT